jgi:hypothetical protein
MDMKIFLCTVITVAIVFISISDIKAALPDTIYRVGATETPGFTWGVFVKDSLAYIADRSSLTIVDVSDPSNPIVISSVSPGVIQPAVVTVVDTFAHTINIGPQFAIASVADPLAPYQIGWTNIPVFNFAEPKGLFVSDTLAYLPDAEEGLVIVNVADPSFPSVISVYNTPGVAVDLFMRDSLVYIADYDSLQIINVINPLSPIRVGALPLSNRCFDVAVIGDYAFVTVESNIGTDGLLEVVDVSDPTNPSTVESAFLDGDPRSIYVSGNYAYVAAADHFLPTVEGGLRVVDVSIPSSVILIASYETPGDPRDVFVVGDLVYVADYDSLQIFRHISVGIEENDNENLQVQNVELLQNQPNPFNKLTAISYQIPQTPFNKGGSRGIHVSLNVYDISGRIVETLVNEYQDPGIYQVKWDRNVQGSGIYFYRLSTRIEQDGDFTQTRKMILLR